MTGKRKRWSAAEKLRIVLAGMEAGVEVSDLCRREGLNPTMRAALGMKIVRDLITRRVERARRIHRVP